MPEIGEIKDWTSTEARYERKYIKVEPSYPHCANCGKKLEPDVWYIQVKDEIYCSEECVLAKYDWLPGSYHTKVGELKGHKNIKNIQRIECTCSGIAIWIAHGNRKFDAKERRKFIEEHKDHELKDIVVISTVS